MLFITLNYAMKIKEELKMAMISLKPNHMHNATLWLLVKSAGTELSASFWHVKMLYTSWYLVLPPLALS